MDPKRLREATRAEHEATEAGMPLMGPELTRDLYGRVLLALLPVVQGWETWAEAHAPAEVRAMLERRRRSALLRADLSALGVRERDGGERPRGMSPDWDAVVRGALGEAGIEAEGAPGEAFRAAFFGAMYVLEGSTLGGRFIARHVEDVLGLKPGQGDAYFRGHEEATGSMWREVTAEIATVPDALEPVVVVAAKRAFRAFGDAMAAGLAASEPVHK